MVIPRLAILFACAAALAAATSVLAQLGKALSNLEIEQRLLDLGFDPGPVDGKFDAKTAPALKAFQKKAGVPQSGKVDNATIAELIASGEAKMLHALPAALLPLTTAPENFGTKIILRHAAERPGAMDVLRQLLSSYSTTTLRDGPGMRGTRFADTVPHARASPSAHV